MPTIGVLALQGAYDIHADRCPDQNYARFCFPRKSSSITFRSKAFNRD